MVRPSKWISTWLATPLALVENVAEQFLTAHVICCEPETGTIGLLKNPTTSNCS